jgi:bifunctional non-homologous end joining protein LigD
MRNMPFATVVAPFSLRARPRPSMACVLEWDELDHVAPDAILLDGAADRLAHPDPLVALDAHPSDSQRFVAAVDEVFHASGLELVPFDRFRS